MENNYIAVIQAGGRGTRLTELTKDRIPKPLLQLNGKPMIQWQIEAIARYGIRNIVLILGHLGNAIKDYFGDGAKLGVRLSYIEEDVDEPLGSAGALYYLKDKIESTKGILLLFGDVMFDIDLDRMIAFHEGRKAQVTLLVHPNSHPFDSDLVVMDEDARIKRFDSKNKARDYYYDNMVNAGVFLLQKQVLQRMQRLQKLDMEKGVIQPLLSSSQVYGYHTTEYAKDVGTVQRFYQAQKEQAEGIWRCRNLENKQRCIFVDRDGTLNRYNGLIDKTELLELERHAAGAVKLINESGYLAICVTNQPVVARGLCSIEDINELHKKLATLLGQKGAYLDDITFCPHHPDKGYPGENPIYKIKCGCRKPATGMIDAMVQKYNIDVAHSYFVGDSTIDIQTGINAGLRTILVQTGQAGKDGKYQVKADYESNDLYDAVRRIIKDDRLQRKD